MGRFLTVALVALGIAAGIAVTRWKLAAGPDGKWRKIAKGVEYQQLLLLNEDMERVVGHALRIDLQNADLRVLDSRSLGSPAAKAEDFANRTGAIAVINGGFFDTSGAPLGLVIASGKTISRWLNRDWGVFLIRSEKKGHRHSAQIVHSNIYKRNTLIKQALEVGPRLVVSGRPVRLKPQSARRSAIGIQHDGRVIVFASEKSLSLTTLADLFARREGERRQGEIGGGFGCIDALHLDGGASSQLHVRTPAVMLNLPGRALVPTAIGVFTSSGD